MKKIIARNFDFSLMANSDLITLVMLGSTDFAVKNDDGFVDFAIFGVEGIEQTEILPISLIADNIISTTDPSEFNHASKVYCTKYDQIALFKAAVVGGVEPVDGDYVELETKDIDIENIETYFEDVLGNDDSRYKFKYKNSIAVTFGDFHDPIIDESRDYCTVSFFKNLFYTEKSEYTISRMIEGVSDFIDSQIGRYTNERLFFHDSEELLDTDVSMKSYFPKNLPIKSITETMIMDKGVEVELFNQYIYQYKYYIKFNETGNLVTRPQGMRLKMVVGFFDEPPMDLQMLTAKMVDMEIKKTEGEGVKGDVTSEKIGRYKVEFGGSELLSIGFYNTTQIYSDFISINAV